MIVGTAGHIDHGKTSLVRALTGVDTDRLKEEKARGISIELGFAYMPSPDGPVIGFIDVPGHEKFVHTMLAGATGIDFALIVVAADDGVMPQTREHLAIIDLLGISRGIVVLTKSDVASPARLAEAKAEIAGVLSSTGLADVEIVPVSVVTGEGVDALRQRLFDAAHAAAARSAEGRFRLAVDRAFTLVGAGTIVTGTVLSGRVAVGDRVTISPSGLEARVRSIHAQNHPAEQGFAGQRCALNLAGDGITKNSLKRGDVVLDPVLHAPTARIDVTLRLLPGETKPLTQWMPVRLHHASAEVGARVVLLGDEAMLPGADAFVQLVLEQPIAAAAGDRFILRDTTAQRTISGGTLLDLRAPARKRRTPERMAQLAAQATADAPATLAALLELAPFSVDLTGFERDRALSATQTAAMTQDLDLIIATAGAADIALSPPVWLRFQRSLLATLDAFHIDNPDLPGLGLERLRMQLVPRLPAPAFRAFLQRLVKASEIALDGAWVRLAGHSVRLTSEDEASWRRIAPLLSGGERFRPPRVRDIATGLGMRETEVRRLLKLLGRLGRVDEVAQDHFFLRGTVSEMVEIIVALTDTTDGGQISAAQFRDCVDNGRKVAIQILEFFDRHGVTLRRGDLRRINRHRLDLFRRPADDAVTPGGNGGESSPVGRPDFKSGKGREPVLGGFDPLSLPPNSRSAAC